jgi:hypothetical protein
VFGHSPRNGHYASPRRNRHTKEARKYFFFEKKKQKTFARCSQPLLQTITFGVARNKAKVFPAYQPNDTGLYNALFSYMIR